MSTSLKSLRRRIGSMSWRSEGVTTRAGRLTTDWISLKVSSSDVTSSAVSPANASPWPSAAPGFHASVSTSTLGRSGAVTHSDSVFRNAGS